MVSRFFLIFALAKLLTSTELGQFGLMVSTVMFCVLIVGADFYTYSQRELLARGPEGWSFVIQQQIKAQQFLYFIFLPLVLGVFIFGLMDWQYAGWLLLLLLLEHIAQEINRLLIAMQKQLLASLILFVRTGLWVLIIIPMMYFNDNLKTLNTVFISWGCGVFIAIILGVVSIRQVLPKWEKVSLDRKWIKRGLQVGSIFLISTLCMMGLLTFDRYFIESLTSTNILGVYVFYMGLVMGGFNILEPAVFSFLYPKMLASYKNNEKKEYKAHAKELVWSTMLVSLLIAFALLALAPTIVNWIGEPIYTMYLDILPILISVGFVYTIGYIPHYILYAKRGDKWIVTAHISAMIIFLGSVKWGYLGEGIRLVGFSLLIAFIWMFIIKTLGCFMSDRTENYLMEVR